MRRFCGKTCPAGDLWRVQVPTSTRAWSRRRWRCVGLRPAGHVLPTRGRRACFGKPHIGVRGCPLPRTALLSACANRRDPLRRGLQSMERSCNSTDFDFCAESTGRMGNEFDLSDSVRRRGSNAPLVGVWLDALHVALKREPGKPPRREPAGPGVQSGVPKGA